MKKKVVSKKILEYFEDGTEREFIVSVMNTERQKNRNNQLLEFKAILSTENLKNYIHVLHKELKLGDRNIARTVYLASYLDISGKLVYDNNKPITKKNLDKVLKISASEKRKFLNELSTLNILSTSDEDSLYFNPEYFRKSSSKSLEYSRLFINTIRQLYEELDINSLALVYKILPYISFWHNILSYNASTKSIEDIQAMTWEQFASLVGWSNGYDFKKKVKRYKLLNGEDLFKAGTVGDVKLIYINPRLVYRNSNSETFKTLLAIFKVSN